MPAARNHDLSAVLCLHSLEQAIQSLDTLNDQIVQFIFSPKACQIEIESENYDDAFNINGTNPQTKQQREALKSSMALMRRLLVDAQAKFRKMVEDNKQLATRIDGDIQTAHENVSLLRAELADTTKIITKIVPVTSPSCNNINGETSSSGNGVRKLSNSNQLTISSELPLSNDRISKHMNGDSITHSGVGVDCLSCVEAPAKHEDTNQLKERLSTLEEENEKLTNQNESLQKQVEELQECKRKSINCENECKPKVGKLELELSHARDALTALKIDRKRLKSEKFDLLNQMKQLYGTLEDKEKELRDFIRSYEQCMRESDKSVKKLAKERDESEREKWNILKHARDEAERSVALCAQLGLKEAQMKQLEEENRHLRGKSNLDSMDSMKSKSSRSCLSSSGEVISVHDHIDRDSNATPTPSCTSSPQPIITIDSDYSPPNGNKAVQNANLLSPSLHPGSPQGLSRSAEEIYNSVQTLPSSTMRRKHKKKENRSTWNSISRVFSRNKHRKSVDTSIYEYNKRLSWSPPNSNSGSPLKDDTYAEKIKLLEEAQSMPMERWKAQMVIAWLEISLGMGQYVGFCAENVKSGKVLLELNDHELETGIGIQNNMHRKKLRLAIEEHREAPNSMYPKISHLTHTWVVHEWLPSIGLGAYSEIFSKQLVDGRMLDKITKKELEKYLNVTRKFHQVSLIHAIDLLRIVQFDKQVLDQRRSHCENMDIDPLVWTNQRFIKWAKSIDLTEYADNLRDSGVHGALVVLEPSFNAEAMATALGIPTSKNIIRRYLTTELENLVQPARMSIEAESVVNFKRNKFPTSSLGRSFVRSHSKNSLDKAEKKRTSLRGSLSKALGMKVKQDLQSSPSLHSAKDSSCASITTSFTSSTTSEQQSHRRVRSQSDIDTVTVTPV